MTWDKDSFLEWELAAWAQRGSGGGGAPGLSRGPQGRTSAPSCWTAQLSAERRAQLPLSSSQNPVLRRESPGRVWLMQSDEDDRWRQISPKRSPPGSLT